MRRESRAVETQDEKRGTRYFSTVNNKGITVNKEELPVCFFYFSSTASFQFFIVSKKFSSSPSLSPVNAKKGKRKDIKKKRKQFISLRVREIENLLSVPF